MSRLHFPREALLAIRILGAGGGIAGRVGLLLRIIACVLISAGIGWLGFNHLAARCSDSSTSRSNLIDRLSSECEVLNLTGLLISIQPAYVRVALGFIVLDLFVS